MDVRSWRPWTRPGMSCTFLRLLLSLFVAYLGIITIQGIWFSALPVLVAAVEVAEGQQDIVITQGQSVGLLCDFTTSASLGNLYVMWTFQPSTANNVIQVISYMNGQITPASVEFAGRVGFLAPMPKLSASIFINRSTVDDAGTYNCLVNNIADSSGGGTGVRRLSVLVPPTPPACTLHGLVLPGANVTLTCNSAEGVPPPVYSWHGLTKTLPKFSILDRRRGTLLLRNLSASAAGKYICSSLNQAGKSNCTITITLPQPLYEPSMGLIAGAAAGGLLALLLLLLLLACSCRSSGSRRHAHDDDIPNDIRMDAAPPQRTPSKTGSHGPSRRPSDHGSGSPGIRSIRRSGSSAANGPSYGSLSRLPSNSGPADRPSSASGQNATEPLTPPPSYVVDASSAAVVSSPHPGSQCGSRSTPGTVRRGQRRKAADNQESPAADSISVNSLRSSVHAPIRPSRWKQPSSGGSLPPNLGAPASPYTSRSSQGQPVSPHIPRPKQGPPSSPHIHRPTQDPPASPHSLRSSQASTASPHLQRPAQGPPVSPRAPGLNQTSVLLSRPPLPKTHPPSHFPRNAPDNQVRLDGNPAMMPVHDCSGSLV